MRATAVPFICNTIVSGNSAASGANEDICGSFYSDGYNLVGTMTGGIGFNQTGDIAGLVQLGALQNNGGQTYTFAPATNSPAVNAGNNCVVDLSCGTSALLVALTYDQRGVGYPEESVRRSRPSI